MSVKIAEQQIRKARKLTLREFPERDQHISSLEQFVKLTKAGTPPPHRWQRAHLGYVFAGTPTEAATVATPPETLAEARAWDARKARLVHKGYSDAEAARAAWAV
ncbi:hypothetical protein B7435_23665 [Mycolicibacterium peregrinum]|uniref:hypothetical protein n=1 Tax=Mycolicibacterium peregrinum TaxID=43304 RepID=UPI000B4ACBD4|nr:hypothetical protein [Mycolicibacterium peregrinum]MCP3811378.1 hypothetical protein [Mycobacteriaceae bacterium Msp059]OWL98896.1 hypothetical protein B7435_23665 [Mycolicibacterium peregrinum]